MPTWKSPNSLEGQNWGCSSLSLQPYPWRDCRFHNFRDFMCFLYWDIPIISIESESNIYSNATTPYTQMLLHSSRNPHSFPKLPFIFPAFTTVHALLGMHTSSSLSLLLPPKVQLKAHLLQEALRDCSKGHDHPLSKLLWQLVTPMALGTVCLYLKPSDIWIY